MTRHTLLAALDLERPDLAAVKAARDRGDGAAARAAFARHLRTRTTPRWFWDPAAPPPNDSSGERARADQVLAHTFEVVGVRHTFGPTIDWAYNPTAQPDSPVARNHEWTWQLNRHGGWQTLARIYTATGDARYGHELSRQLVDWIDRNPPPADKADNEPFSRWRTIEAGIRMLGAWPNIYHYLVRKPDVFGDDVLVGMVESFRQHAHYLHAHPTGGNWLIMEMSGLFTAGVLFPEFEQAATWRQVALARLRGEMDVQIYPDGAQFELSPGYHNGMIGNFVGVLKLARLNDIALPPGYEETLERMYALLLWAMSPDRDVPYLNDSWHIDVPRRLEEGLKLFPTRTDWEFVATNGKQGQAPAHTSHLFPYAGWAVMRSGWDRDARFLLLDAGPFGYGHQHEDKLSFVLHAWGARLVFDAGSYAYDNSEMRRYVLSARGHNVVHVDGLEQNRRGLDRMTYVAKAPAPLVWKTGADYDYAQARFGEAPEEGWGPDRKKHVVHTRRVLFVKAGAVQNSDYWIVVDTLMPTDTNDTAEHLYESTFHLDTPEVLVDQAAKTVHTKNPDAANLGIFPIVVCAEPALSVRVITGQETPFVQGWLPIKHNFAGANPRPTVYFTQRARGPVHFLYVFAPAPPGKAVPVIGVKPAQVDDAMLAADVMFAPDATHRFVLQQDGCSLIRETQTLHVRTGAS